MNFLDQLKKILPDSVDSSTIDAIAEACNEHIEREIEEASSDVIDTMSTKFVALVRSSIDDLKEHALKELEQENPLYRNAQVFENLRGIMALELSNTDRDYALQEAASTAQKTSDEFDAIMNVNEQLINETNQLKAKLSRLETKNNSLVEKYNGLVDEHNELLEESSAPMELSDRAVVVSRADADVVNEASNPDNPFITEETISLMKNLNG